MHSATIKAPAMFEISFAVPNIAPKCSLSTDADRKPTSVPLCSRNRLLNVRVVIVNERRNASVASLAA
jgi:hypothetical protein